MDNKSLKNIEKTWMSSLSWLDNTYVSSVIVFILILFLSGIFHNINMFFAGLHKMSVFRVFVILLVIYVFPKNHLIAILLLACYILSQHNADSSREMFMAKPTTGSSTPTTGSSTPTTGSSTPTTTRPQMKQPVPSEEHHASMATSEEHVPMKRISKSSPTPVRKHEKMPSEESPILKRTIESFIPMAGGSDSENMFAMPSSQKQSGGKHPSHNVPSSNLSQSECMNLYTPHFESVGNVCQPTATFQNELNAQGLNFPEGFDDITMGSPLN